MGYADFRNMLPHKVQPGAANTMGSYYLWYRIYDIRTGRFTGPDPAKQPAWNVYNYGLDNPYKYKDPDGNEPITLTVIAVAAVWGLVSVGIGELAEAATTDHYEWSWRRAGGNFAFGAITGGAGAAWNAGRLGVQVTAQTAGRAIFAGTTTQLTRMSVLEGAGVFGLSSMGGSATSQLIQTGSVDPSRVLADGVFGAAFGAAGGYARSMAAQTSWMSGGASSFMHSSSPNRAGRPGVGEVGTFEELAKGGGLQRHHLNQEAIFKGVKGYSREQGAAIRLAGNAITDAGSPHYMVHATMEAFFDAARKAGSALPNIGQYNRTLNQALKNAGVGFLKRHKAMRLMRAEQRRMGFSGCDPIPKIPGRLNQKIGG